MQEDYKLMRKKLSIPKHYLKFNMPSGPLSQLHRVLKKITSKNPQYIQTSVECFEVFDSFLCNKLRGLELYW